MNAETQKKSIAPTLEQRRSFVVVTSQRTGSTLLIRSLDSSPRVFCAGEIFHTGPNVYHREFRYPHWYLGSQSMGRLIDSLSGHRVRNHLQHFYTNAGVGVAAVGFKLMTSQIRTFRAIMPVLKDLGVYFLYLYRADTFATALSYYKAKASGVFHSDRVSKTKKQSSMSIDEEELRQLFEVCKSHKNQILDLQKTHGGCLLSYENMISDWQGFIAMVGVEIGIKGLRLQKALSKLQSGPDSVPLANEGSLRKRFSSETR